MIKALCLVAAVLFPGTSYYLTRRTLDTTAPEVIADITASAPGSATCLLSWTAPHEDGASGGAVSSYDCRYCLQSTCSTTMDNTEYGASATALTGEPSSPATPGVTDSFTASGLAAASAYVFNCKSTDDASNTSAIGTQSGTCTTTSCTQAVNDDFTTYVDWSTHWSGQSGPFAIVSNEFVAEPDGGTGVAKTAAYLTPVGSADMWAKVRITSRTVATDQRGVALRFAAGDYTGNSVAVTTDDTTLEIEKRLGNSNAGAIITAQAITVPAAPYWMAVQVTGTGSSTVFKIWLSSADPGSCPSVWDAGGGAGVPTATIDNTDTGWNAANLVDTGGYAGLKFFFINSTDEVHISQVVYGTGS